MSHSPTAAGDGGRDRLPPAAFVPLMSLLEEHMLPERNDPPTSRLPREARQAIQWYRFYLGREPAAADLRAKHLQPWFQFCRQHGLTSDTIRVYRKALAEVWQFAHAQSLARACPKMPMVSERIPVKRDVPEPGTVEHYLEGTYRQRPLATWRLRRLQRTVLDLSLFLGRRATLAELDEPMLGKFRDFLSRLPRRRMTGAARDVKMLRTMLAEARPDSFIATAGDDGQRVPKAGTLRHCFENLYMPEKLLGKAPTTVHDYRLTLNGFERFVGDDFPLASIDDAVLGRYFAHLLANARSRATVNKQRRSLIAVLRFAHRRKLTDFQTEGAALREYEREPECWSLDEMAKLLKAAREMPGQVGDVPAGVWWPALILFVYNCGTRIDATVRIPSSCLNLKRGEVLVPGELQKDKADQRFELLPDTVQALLALRPQREERIFGAWRIDAQEIWHPLNKKLRSILRRAGLPSGRRDLWHKLRRTFATHVAARAGTAYASERLGHSSLAVTKRYIDRRFMDLPTIRDVLPSISEQPAADGGAA